MRIDILHSATATNKLTQFSYRKNYKSYNGKNDKVAIQQKD